MKNKLKHLLSLIVLGIAASAIAQTEPADSTYWIRPVKAPNNDTVAVFTMNEVTYYLPVGVYVQVAEEKNGDVFLGGERLATDTAPVTDDSRKRKITQAEFDRAEALKKHLSVINDSLLAVNLKDVEGQGRINIYVRGKLVSSKPEYGKNDTLDLQTLGIKKAKGVIILAQDSMLSTYAKVEELQKVKKDFSTPALPKKDEDPGLPWYWWLIIAIIALALVASAIIKRDWIKGLFAGGKNKNLDEIAVCQEALKKLDSTVNKTLEKLEKKAKVTVNQRDNFKDAVIRCINAADEMNSYLDNNQGQQDDYRCLNTMIENSIKTIKSVFEDHAEITKITEKISNQAIEYNRKLNELKSKGDKAAISDSASKHDPKSDPKSDPKAAPKPVKQETGEEKIARLESEIKSLNANLKVEKSAKESAQKELENVRGKLADLKDKQEEIISKKVESVQSECSRKIVDANASAQKKIADTNASAQKKVDAANDRAKKAEDKANAIAGELNRKFDEEREKVKAEKKRLNETLDTTRNELQTTTATLRATEESLSKANRKVENLTAETESFHKHLSGVPDSKAYCDDIVKLIALAKNVQESAAALLKANIEDKYYIFKALALYTGKLDTINLTTLYADVEMISKTGFVIKGTPLATYDPNLPKTELQSLTKNYFFTTYLKTYFDALVVLNESMAGLNYLIGDVTPADLKAFAGYRSQIEAIARKLGINILTVKIYDAAGSNTDLLATEVDAGVEKHGAILEIENCKVSLIGGAPDHERIIVKIQK